MPDDVSELIRVLSALGVPDAGERAGLMLDYMKLVLERNRVMNLTAVKDEGEFVRRHLVDSVSPYGRPRLMAARRVADVGAGAGFPGIPLAIACPDKEFLLIDSQGKRTNFIDEACAKLGITNVRTLHARAEEAAHMNEHDRRHDRPDAEPIESPGQTGKSTPLRESFDVAVSRAVGHLSILCEYCLPLVRVGGVMYAYKSGSQAAEADESANARMLLGAAPEVEIFPAGAPPDGPTPPHIIIAVSKKSPTPARYPRRPGVPAKSPLM